MEIEGIGGAGGGMDANERDEFLSDLTHDGSYENHNDASNNLNELHAEETNVEAGQSTERSQLQPPQQQWELSGEEHETLARKKRSALSLECGQSSSPKKSKLDDLSGATMQEIMEAMNFGLPRKYKSKMPKKKGRKSGSKKKLAPEISQMLMEAMGHYSHDRYLEARSVLKEVVKIQPNVPDSFHFLGIIEEELGNFEGASKYFQIAANLMPNSDLWATLCSMYLKRGHLYTAIKCLSRAINKDPHNIQLRVDYAELHLSLGNYQKAAASFEQITRINPKEVRYLNTAAKLYFHCGQIEKSVCMLEEYVNQHPSEVDYTVIDMLAAILMENNAYDAALRHIESTRLLCSGEGLPRGLKVKAGICYIHLGDSVKAEGFFDVLQEENVAKCTRLIPNIADAFMRCKQFHSALKYYRILESHIGSEWHGYSYVKTAECYLALKEREKAIMFFYKALPLLHDSVDARLALVSLMLEDAKEDEAISLLSPPGNLEELCSKQNTEERKPWWLDAKIKLKLCQIYRAKGMLEDFVNTIFPLVRESLYVKTRRQKVKKKLTTSVLRKRAKILDIQESNDIFGGVRPLASPSELLKANRARRSLKKKEEQKAAAIAAGIDWNSEASDDESLGEEEVRVPPLPNFLKDGEHHDDLIIDLCKASQSLQRYWEALEIISFTRGLVELDVGKKEELRSLASQISFSTTDPKHAFDCVRSIVLQHPYSSSAWNCCYKVTSRLGKNHSKLGKFLRYMRSKYKDCVPPLVISGHQLSIVSQHQDAAREYLEAHKLLPNNPLINLCVGSTLVNLALGFRLQNKHQCVVQGLAFLHNNLQLTKYSQEAWYNLGRAYHHVGLVTLAVHCYEKVLSSREKDYPIPKLLNENSDPEEFHMNTGYCDLRREAAYNLHLIYKRSGAVDLARQVLKDHCTF